MAVRIRKETEMTTFQRAFFSVTMGAAGLWLTASVDWRVALGVFLMLWGNNASRSC